MGHGNLWGTDFRVQRKGSFMSMVASSLIHLMNHACIMLIQSQLCSVH
jgi:hypothetical protein